MHRHDSDPLHCSPILVLDAPFVQVQVASLSVANEEDGEPRQQEQQHLQTLAMEIIPPLVIPITVTETMNVVSCHGRGREGRRSTREGGEYDLRMTWPSPFHTLCVAS